VRGSPLSVGWFLQADAKQAPPAMPSRNGQGLCRSAGEFWKARQAGASGSAVLTCPLSVAMQVGQPTGARHLEKQGQPVGSGRWTWFCGDTEPLLLPTAWRRTGRGLGRAVPLACQLSGACELEALTRRRGSSCQLHARPADHSALCCRQGTAGQAAEALAWRSPLTGSHSVCLCSGREQQQQQQQEEEGSALALGSAAQPGRRPSARAGRLRLQQGALWTAPGSPLSGRWHAAPAHPGKADWPGGPTPPSLHMLRTGRAHSYELRARTGDWALRPQQGARAGAGLWPALLPGTSSAKQRSSCLSCRS